MINTNSEPDFLIIWKSLDKAKKRILINEFTEAAGKDDVKMADITFFRKKKKADWSKMEKSWWAQRLGYSVEQLFPNL